MYMSTAQIHVYGCFCQWIQINCIEIENKSGYRSQLFKYLHMRLHICTYVYMYVTSSEKSAYATAFRILVKFEFAKTE